MALALLAAGVLSCASPADEANESVAKSATDGRPIAAAEPEVPSGAEGVQNRILDGWIIGAGGGVVDEKLEMAAVQRHVGWLYRPHLRTDIAPVIAGFVMEPTIDFYGEATPAYFSGFLNQTTFKSSGPESPLFPDAFQDSTIILHEAGEKSQPRWFPISFLSRPKIISEEGGLDVGRMASFHSQPRLTAKGTSRLRMGIRRGMWIREIDVQGAGASLGRNVAIEIEELKSGETNIGILNHASTVDDPGPVVQVGPDVTIPSLRGLLEIAGPAGAAVRVRATPAIAPGVRGQRLTLINVGDAVVVLPDGRSAPGSGLRLPGGDDLRLERGDSVTLAFTEVLGWVALHSSRN